MCTSAKPITRLFQRCLTLAYHPRQFKTSTTVVLKKPQREDYTKAKAYRPIALLNTLGKLLERIVADRISQATETHHLLPDYQMGARRSRSAVTALSLLTEQIHTVWKQDPALVASVLSLDISRAYDHVSHKRLLHNMKAARLPGWVERFTHSFLSDRLTQLLFGGYTSQAISTPTGIPQGSSLSPILYLFFASNLLTELRRGNVFPLGFVDDTNILTFSRSIEHNCRVLEGANRTCEKWAATHGSAFSPDKYHLIHFSRKPRRFNMAAKIQIPGFEGNPEPLIKILGVHVDSKLRWGPHIKETSAKATRKCMSLTRLAASTWGASFTKARHIYTAAVRPVLTYGCGVWHTPEGTLGWRRIATKPLEKIQNQCLRTIAGAYKSTPTQTLEHETGIPPLPLHLDELTLAHSIRTREGPATAVIEATCRDIKAAVRAAFSAKGIAGPARGKLLRGRVNSLLSSCPPNTQKLPQRT